MEVVRLLVANSMLGTHTTFVITAELHDEGIDHLVEAGLSLRSVLIAFHGNVEVHVTVTNVTMAIAVDSSFLSLSEETGLSYMLSGGFNHSVVGVSLKGNIVFQSLNIINSGLMPCHLIVAFRVFDVILIINVASFTKV
jgi:hypothetical protein